MNLKKLRRYRFVFNTLAVLATIGFFIRIALNIHDKASFIFLILLLVFDIIFGVVKLRCPYCKARLNIWVSKQNYCESCGAKINA